MKMKEKNSKKMTKGKGKIKGKVKGNIKASSSHKIFKKRFKVPFILYCYGCNINIRNGEKVKAIKESVGNYCGREIWGYNLNCPSCGHLIVLDRISGDTKYKVVEGAFGRKTKWGTLGDPGVGEKTINEDGQEIEFDWKAWKKERVEYHLDWIAPNLSNNSELVNNFPVRIVRGDLRSDEPLRVLL